MHSPFHKLQLFLLALICLSSVSCKKFLEAYSQNDSFIGSAEDLEELLIQDGYFEPSGSPFSPVLFEMDDDVQMGILGAGYVVPMQDGYYKWKTNPRVNSEGQLTATDDYFTKFYTRISRLNTILETIPELKRKGSSEVTLNRLAGESYFLRAYYYFFLANVFGKPYNIATATADFSVPLKLEASIKDRFATRATTKQVFDQMVADLLEAEKLLGNAHESSRIRINKTVVQLFLSRVYLFMENYEEAVRFADRAIQNTMHRVEDLNTFNTATSFLVRSSRDIVFTMCNSKMHAHSGLQSDEPPNMYFVPSDELINLYDNNDLRKNAFYVKNSKGAWKFAKTKFQINNTAEAVGDMFLLRKTEAYLNKAEALAVLGKTTEARTTIQELRKNRFRPADLTDVTEEDAALVNFIRDERRRELMQEGHRWFDLRRYAVNSLFPLTKTIRHRNLSLIGGKYQEDGYYELGTYNSEPGSYIMPIAQDEIEFNQGLLTNESRPERPLKH